MAARTTKIEGLGSATFVRWNAVDAADAAGVASTDAAGVASTDAAAAASAAGAALLPSDLPPVQPSGEVAVFFREPTSGARSIVTTIEWIFDQRLMIARTALIAEIPAICPGGEPRALCVMFRAPPADGSPGMIAMLDLDRASLSHALQKLAAAEAAPFGRIRGTTRASTRAAVCMDALMTHVDACIRDPARLIAPHTVDANTLRGICRALKHLHGFGFDCASNILINHPMAPAANVVWEIIAHSLWA